MDCRDALEMICNLEAEGDERGAFTLCSGFLTRQLLQEDSYCAWSVPEHNLVEQMHHPLVFYASEISDLNLSSPSLNVDVELNQDSVGSLLMATEAV